MGKLSPVGEGQSPGYDSTSPFQTRSNPHTWSDPTLTEANVPVGMMPVGGMACASALPQHARVPSVLTPQDSTIPMLTEVNVPVGGAGCSPQHARVPSVLGILRGGRLLANVVTVPPRRI
jgi:hypothetical protein